MNRQAHPAVYQPWPITSANRHPQFYQTVAERLGDRADARILSFGCATGEEVFALSRHLPHARLDGVDINKQCIIKARKRTPSKLRDRLHFSAGSAVPDGADRFDAIFCLSVLRHPLLDAERPIDCSEVFPFARFEEAICSFDRALKLRGLLVVWGANFVFSDTSIAGRYRKIDVENKRAQKGAFYGKNNERLQIAGYDGWIFEKVA